MIKKLVRRFSKKKLIIFLGDSFTIAVGSILALSFSPRNYGIEMVSPFENPLKSLYYAIAGFLLLVTFRYLNLYKQKYYHTISTQFIQIIKAIFISALFLIISTFFVKTKSLENDSRLQLILFCLFNLVLSLSFRLLIYKYFTNSTENWFFTRRIIAIGAGDVGEKFGSIVTSKHSLFLKLICFIDDDISKVGKTICGVKVLGTIGSLFDIVEKEKIDEIYITIESIDHNRLFKLIQIARETNCQVNLVSSHYQIINNKVDNLEFSDFISVPIFTRISPIYSEQLKRVFDLLLTMMSILILSPVLLIIGLIIKISSKGPVLYETYVIGKNGIPFKWYKFRSMYHNNQQLIHEEHLKEIISKNKSVKKISNDPRITPVGRFIRKYSIDELPQLLNVLKGEMSLVGPRPNLPYEYEVMNDWQKKRFKVKPGITGLWQIAGRNRTDVNFNDSIILDLYYSDNISFWFDLKILFRTIPVVILGKGGI